MPNPKLKPLFNAAYLAIFLRFARKTYRKLNPYRMRFRRRYAVDIPYGDYVIVIGSCNSQERLVDLANETIEQFPDLSLEIIDLEKLNHCYVNTVERRGKTCIDEVVALMTGMPPKSFARTTYSVFDPHGDCIVNLGHLKKLRRIATRHHQNEKTTSLEELIA